MNKQIYFVAGIVATLLVVSMFSMVSAWEWPWQASERAQLGPSGNTTPTAVCGPDIRPSNVYACKSVQAPQGTFGNLSVNGVAFIGGNNPGKINLQSFTISDSSQLGNPISLFTDEGHNYSTMVADFIGGLEVRGQLAVYDSERGGPGRIFTGRLDSVSDIQTKYGNISISPLYGTGDLYIGKLRGNGTAYACLDAEGKLFRSNTACR